jgi:hypothetical protein
MDLHHFENPDLQKSKKNGSRTAPDSKAGSGSASKSKFRSFGGSKLNYGGPWTLAMEA